MSFLARTRQAGGRTLGRGFRLAKAVLGHGASKEGNAIAGAVTALAAAGSMGHNYMSKKNSAPRTVNLVSVAGRPFPQSSQGVRARKKGNKKNHGGKKNKRYYVVHIPYREECLGNVVSSGTAGGFQLQSYVLNIGNQTSFPQGSIPSPQYQRHRFRKLIYRIETTSGMAIGSTSTALGSTLMNCDYNIVDAVFPDQIHMEDYGKNGVKKACKEAVIYKNNTFTVDCSRSLALEPDDWMFVQPGTTGTTATPIANTSEHEYAHGLMQIASVGLQGTAQVIGRLFVGYESDFAICITPVDGVSALSAHVVEGPNASATQAHPLGTTAGVLRAGSTIPVVSTTTTFSMPLTGTYLVTATWTGTGIVAVPTFTPGTAITAQTVLTDDTATSTTCINAGGTVTTFTAVYKVATPGTAAANLITIGGVSSMTAATLDLYLCQLNANIVASLPPTSLTMASRLEAMERRLSSLNNSSSSSSSSFHRRIHVPLDDEDSKELATPHAACCPNCDVVKLSLPFGGYCSRSCLYESDIADGIVTQRVQGDDVVLTLGPKHIVSSGSHKK